MFYSQESWVKEDAHMSPPMLSPQAAELESEQKPIPDVAKQPHRDLVVPTHEV